MVFFNYATMQMAAKIVYYGPGLCGKTTNLHHIYGRTAPDSRGEMVSLETETDRTLFFDLLPLDVGVISGFKTRVQLYTVPGQVFYNTTRKLVLKGVDGVVFVADSQRAMKEANLESFTNLRANLAEIGLNLEDLPLALQDNKRDLTSILSVDELQRDLNGEGAHESYEASAIHGQGVFETLKAISRLTLRSLKKRMLGEDRATPKTSVAVTAPPVLRETPSAVPVAPPPPAVKAPAPRETAAAASPKAAPPPKRRPASHPQEEAMPDIEFEFDEGDAAEVRAPVAVVSEEISDVSFAETNEAPPGGSEVKHVRVGSNVDILAELERLRKNATSLSPAARPARRGGAAKSVDDLLAHSLNHRKEVSRVFDLHVPRKELAAGQNVTVSLRFTDRNDRPVGESKDFSVSLDSAQDLEKLLLNLKFQIFGK